MQTNSNVEKFQKTNKFKFSEIERTQQGRKLNKTKHTQRKTEWEELEQE